MSAEALLIIAVLLSLATTLVYRFAHLLAARADREQAETERLDATVELMRFDLEKQRAETRGDWRPDSSQVKV